MNVLVTGATGFLGQHLLKELETRNIHTIALSRAPTGDVRIKQGNLLDPSTYSHHLEGIDTIIHAAGLVSHDPEDTERVWREVA